MSNLDDFFKKRDKKKKTVTAKSKFSTLDTEQLAKNLEAVTVIQADETDPDFQDQPARERVPASENQDEEWKPFDSEENRDYTGLRINMQTWADEDEQNEQGGEFDENAAKPAWVASAWGSKKKEANDEQDEDEDKDDKEEDTASQEPKSMAEVVNEIKTNEAAEAKPAETAAAPAAAAPTPGAYIPPSMRARIAAEAAAKPAEAAKPAAPASGGAYVPPSMRNRAPESSGSSAGYEIPTSSVNYRRPNKSQPNLNDCLEFPSLDAAGSDAAPATQNDDRFEFAKKSGRVEPKNEKDNMIHVQNKFATLSSNQ